MTETEAHCAARREAGNVTALQEEYREQNGLPLLENFWYNFEFSVRSMRRNPMFTAACVGTLAVGLGSMMAVFCVLSTFSVEAAPVSKSRSPGRDQRD